MGDHNLYEMSSHGRRGNLKVKFEYKDSNPPIYPRTGWYLEAKMGVIHEIFFSAKDSTLPPLVWWKALPRPQTHDPEHCPAILTTKEIDPWKEVPELEYFGRWEFEY